MPAPPSQLRKYQELDGKTFLVGVGAAKCGTSWIATYLNSLDGVTPSPLKELHFFNTKCMPAAKDMDLFAVKRLVFHLKQDGDVVENMRSRHGFQASFDRARMIYDDNAYFDHFARICTPDTRTFCEITPAYADIGQSGFEYMRDFVASQDVTLKILYVMRDPVDRLWSHLRFRQQNESGLDVLKAWPEMIADPDFVGRADYRETVEALDAVFPEGQILYLFFEDLFSEAALKRLCAFVGAAYVPPEGGDAINETKVKIDLPDDARAELQRVLAPQYEFCRARFGDFLLDSWRDSSV